MFQQAALEHSAAPTKIADLLHRNPNAKKLKPTKRQASVLIAAVVAEVAVAVVIAIVTRFAQNAPKPPPQKHPTAATTTTMEQRSPQDLITRNPNSAVSEVLAAAPANRTNRSKPTNGIAAALAGVEVGPRVVNASNVKNGRSEPNALNALNVTIAANAQNAANAPLAPNAANAANASNPKPQNAAAAETVTIVMFGMIATTTMKQRPPMNAIPAVVARNVAAIPALQTAPRLAAPPQNLA